MTDLNHKIRGAIVKIDQEKKPGDASFYESRRGLNVVRVPLSESGSSYYFIDRLLQLAHAFKQGRDDMKLLLYGSSSTPFKTGMDQTLTDISDYVDFAFEKEFAASEFAKKYSLMGEIEELTKQVQEEATKLAKERDLSVSEKAIGLGLMGMVLNKELRKQSAIVGAVAGTVTGISVAKPQGMISHGLLGLMVGGTLGAISPLLLGAAYLGYKKYGRLKNTGEPYKDYRDMALTLKAISDIKNRVHLLSPSDTYVYKGLDNAFPMDFGDYGGGELPGDKEGAVTRAVLDVLSKDIDNPVLSTKARKFYWNILTSHIKDGFHYRYSYSNIVDDLLRVRPTHTIELGAEPKLTLLPRGSEDTSLRNDWAMPYANPAHTNCIELGGHNTHVDGLILLQAEEYFRESEGIVHIYALDDDGDVVWHREHFKGRTDFISYKMLVHDGNLVITKKGTSDGPPAMEVDLLDGKKEIQTLGFNPVLAFDGLALLVNTSYSDKGMVELRDMKSGSTLLQVKPISEGNIGRFDEEGIRVLGMTNKRLVVDYDNQFLVIDVSNPAEPSVIAQRAKEVAPDYGFSLRNICDQGIVALFYNKRVPRKTGGEQLVTLDYRGEITRRFANFAEAVELCDAPILENQVYMAVGGNTHCIDLNSGEAVWARGLASTTITPTKERVYTMNGTNTLDHDGMLIWEDNEAHELAGTFPYWSTTLRSCITSKYVVQLFSNGAARGGKPFIRLLDKETGMERERFNIGKLGEGRVLLQDLKCVDFKQL